MAAVYNKDTYPWLVTGISVRPLAENNLQKLSGTIRKPAQVGDAHRAGCKYAEGTAARKSCPGMLRQSMR